MLTGNESMPVGLHAEDEAQETTDALELLAFEDTAASSPPRLHPDLAKPVFFDPEVADDLTFWNGVVELSRYICRARIAEETKATILAEMRTLALQRGMSQLAWRSVFMHAHSGLSPEDRIKPSPAGQTYDFETSTLDT